MTKEKSVFKFAKGKADGNASMKNKLGGKGASLAAATLLGLPVPPGFTIATDVCNLFLEKGKIPEEVYESQRAELMAGATEILMMIDGIEEAAMITSPEVISSESPESAEDIDSDIEAAVLRIRHSHQAPGSVHLEPEVHETAAAAVGSGEFRFCPQCGSKTDPDDKFCVNCGAMLKDPQPV